MCGSRNRCVLSLEWLCAKSDGRSSNHNHLRIILFSFIFSPLLLQTAKFYLPSLLGKMLSCWISKGTHQNKMDEENGPQTIKPKSLPNFWEILSSSTKKNIKYITVRPNPTRTPWHLRNSAFPALSGAGFGCETITGWSIKGSFVNFCFSLIAFCLHYGQMSRVSRHGVVSPI